MGAPLAHEPRNSGDRRSGPGPDCSPCDEPTLSPIFTVVA